MIRVLITDDYRLWRMGIRVLLERDQQIVVVGEARDGQEAIELAARLDPDVILMDVEMPRVDGLQATGLLRTRQPKTRVVIFAGSWEEPLVRQAVQNGARGYLPKDIEPNDLISAVHAAFENRTCFDSRVSQWLSGGIAAT